MNIFQLLLALVCFALVAGLWVWHFFGGGGGGGDCHA